MLLIQKNKMFTGNIPLDLYLLEKRIRFYTVPLPTLTPFILLYNITLVGHKIKVCLTSIKIGQHTWPLPCRFSIHQYPYAPTHLLGLKVELWSENILKKDSKKWCWQYSLTVHQTHTFFFSDSFFSHHHSYRVWGILLP